MNAIELRNLTKIYGNRQIALGGVDLDVPRGSVFGLLGPNGAGKTTLMKLIVGLQRPTAGSVAVFGEPVTRNSSHLRKHIGYLPTSPRFPRDMTAISILDLGGRLAGLAPEQRKIRLATALRAVDLLGATSQKVQTFSTGMTTRLGIAASLLHDPDILIWDEPTLGLDPEGRRFTLDLIRSLAGVKTIILSTHLLGDIDRVCDHVGVLSEGKLVFSGSVIEMKRMVRRNEVELDLQGDLVALEKRLDGWGAEPLEFTLLGQHTLRVRFPDGEQFMSQLGRLLQFLSEQSIELLSLRSASDQLESAFLQRLEEERNLGFTRATELDE